MNKITALLLCLILIIGGSYAVAKIFIPPSIEVYLAGIAGCDFDEKALARNDPQFERIKWWELVLMHVYRIEQENYAENFVVADSLTEEQSVYHIMLLASDSTESHCDGEIINLMKRYKKLGAPVDYVNYDGLTALHESVITGNVLVTKTLLELGANAELKNSKKGSPISNMSAIEIATLFLAKNPDNLKFKSILSLLKNEI